MTLQLTLSFGREMAGVIDLLRTAKPIPWRSVTKGMRVAAIGVHPRSGVISVTIGVAESDWRGEPDMYLSGPRSTYVMDRTWVGNHSDYVYELKDEERVFYVVECLACDLEIPFETEEARSEWVRQHGTQAHMFGNPEHVDENGFPTLREKVVTR